MPVEKLTPSFTFTEDRLQALQAVVPEAFADGQVNWETLKEALAPHLEDEGPGTEHFGLFWPGKRQARRLAAQPSKGTLRPLLGQGVNEADTHNLFIEGDNLEVLKLLQKSYAGRVKLIYIDPPYNTGNDFVYKDDFREPLDDYLQRTGQADAEGLLTTNPKAGGRFHSNWLNMMLPRLMLANKFLDTNGVLLISIDDNELNNLVSLVDELFGEENRKIIVVKMSESSGLKMGAVKKYGVIPKLKEYIVLVKKGGVSNLILDLIPKEQWDKEYNLFLSGFKKEDKILIDQINESEIISDDDIKEMDKIISNVKIRSVNEVIKENKISDEKISSWLFENSYRICRSAASSTVLELAEKKRKYCNSELFFVRNNSGKNIYLIRANYDPNSKKPRVQLLFAEDNLSTHPGDLWLDIKTTGLEAEGSIEFKNGKKPLKLIKRLIKLACKDSDIILDFFAGSCTTAHAVMELNHEDGSDRNFIMVQIPEPTPVNSTARSDGYKNITDIGKKRIHNAINIISNSPRSDITAQREKPEDLGFAVYKLDRSHFKAWQDYDGPPDPAALDDLFSRFEDPLIAGWTPRALLDEVLLLQGFPLDSRRTRLNDFPHNALVQVDCDWFSYRLFICLDPTLNPATIAALPLHPDDKFICLDSALTDQTKQQLADRCTLVVL